MKLALLWITRILLAKNHFNVSLGKKLWWNCQGYLADQYILYDLNRFTKKEYLSEFDWYKSRRINGDYKYVLNNKVICSELMKPYVRVPELYSIKKRDTIYGANGETLSEDTLLDLLKDVKECILKPVDGGKGKGVFKIEFIEGQFYLNKQEVDEKKLILKLFSQKEWFISEYIPQAEYLNQIYSKTANTIRIITLRSPETKEWKVFFAVQRIGTSSTIPVDNGSQGGLVSKIDLDSGKLSEARSLHTKDIYEVHPDTGAVIKGTEIPGWRRIKTELVKVADKFPYLDFIAWDILPMDQGYCVIEANASSGVNIIQIWGGQRQQELGNFYRYYKVIS